MPRHSGVRRPFLVGGWYTGEDGLARPEFFVLLLAADGSAAGAVTAATDTYIVLRLVCNLFSAVRLPKPADGGCQLSYRLPA
jgi:hypothetical protein